jgi:hypothetical protein
VASAPPTAFPSSDLLEHLRLLGFEIGIDHHRRLHILLAEVGADLEPQRLKTYLCPLFATNPEQQQAFYEAFDRIIESWSSVAERAEPNRVLSAGSAAEAPAPSHGGSQQKRIRLAMLGLLAVLVLAVIWSIPRLRPHAFQRAHTVTVSPPIVSPEQPATRPPTSVPSPPTSIGRPAFGLGGWADTLRWVLIVAPLFVFAVAEIVRSRRRKLILRRVRAPRPPFAWPIRVPTRANPYARSAELRDLTLALREREPTAMERLSIEPSIAATIDAGGYPTLRYARDTRPAEYLFLIERSSFRDHQTRLFADLAETLWREGVHVTSYAYDEDPRICHPTSGGEPILLANLRRSHPAHRLIIFGGGERLIDPVDGFLASWTELFRSWSDRAVLTPEPPERWSVRERALATEFIVLPATIDGLRTAVALFRTPASPDVGRPRGDAGVEPNLEPAIALEQLRAYLGPQLFRLLCACAIYPELHWDLTLYLAALPSVGEDLVDEDNLLRLVRLPWFRFGSIPDEIRSLLVDRLDPGETLSVREALVGLLERQKVPANSLAAQRRVLDLAVQRYAIAPQLRSSRRQLRRALEQLTGRGEISDHAVLQLLDKAPQSPLVMLLPARIRQLLFRAGIAGLGWSTAGRLAITLISTAALASVVLHGSFATPAPLRHTATPPVVASRPTKAESPPTPAPVSDSSGISATPEQRVEVDSAAPPRTRSIISSVRPGTLRSASARTSSSTDSSQAPSTLVTGDSAPAAGTTEPAPVVSPPTQPIARIDSTVSVPRESVSRGDSTREGRTNADSAPLATDASNGARAEIRTQVSAYVQSLRSRDIARATTLYQSKSAAEERTKKNLLDLMRDQASRLTVVEDQVDSIGVVGAVRFADFKAKLTWRTAFGASRSELVSFRAEFESSNGRWKMTSCKVTSGFK